MEKRTPARDKQSDVLYRVADVCHRLSTPTSCAIKSASMRGTAPSSRKLASGHLAVGGAGARLGLRSGHGLARRRGRDPALFHLPFWRASIAFIQPTQTITAGTTRCRCGPNRPHRCSYAANLPETRSLAVLSGRTRAGRRSPETARRSSADTGMAKNRSLVTIQRGDGGREIRPRAGRGRSHARRPSRSRNDRRQLFLPQE